VNGVKQARGSQLTLLLLQEGGGVLQEGGGVLQEGRGVF
jgi:hypothetical protein